MKALNHPDLENIQLSSVLYALSDPVRLYILYELNKSEERRCGDIDLPIVKSTVTHHVRTLREAGVINVRTQGTQRFLTIRKEDLEARFPGLLQSVLNSYDPSREILPNN